MFDLDQRLVEGGGSWGRQGENAVRLIETDVDVDKVLSVEGVNKALTGSHNGWGSMQQEPRLRVHEDKYRPLKCRY
ncbi:hypothetical protein IEO21_05514 [Rhodonia placenta]|uniref:Uncharacterized protein n=1 Tax=Rhodonia placenta TaxID=104341 RepID=A0A8H7P207_9APHY|nr:hypothetical protein IEO21_05514 [Postia placenta]